jgi:hypothetical protein
LIAVIERGPFLSAAILHLPVARTIAGKTQFFSSIKNLRAASCDLPDDLAAVKDRARAIFI